MQKLKPFIAYIEAEDGVNREGISAFSLDEAKAQIEKDYGRYGYLRVIEVKPMEETLVSLCFLPEEIEYIIDNSPSDVWFEFIVYDLYVTASIIAEATGATIEELGFYEFFNINE